MSIIDQSHNVVDIIHGVIPYNGLEMKIIDNPLFARLHRVYQSSLVYMTFPSNKVHRYEHSLGVMHLSGLFFYYALRNSETQTINKLFEKVIDAYESEKQLLDYDANTQTDMGKSTKRMFLDFLGSGDEDESYKDDDNDGFESDDDLREYRVDIIETQNDIKFLYNNTLFRDNTPSNISKSRIYYVLFEAIRLVGLLHDIGHLPYSHVLEHALTSLNDGIDLSGVDKDKYNTFTSTMKKYDIDNKATAIHELVGLNLVKNMFTNLHKDFNKGDIEEDFFVTSVFNITWDILNAKTGIFLDLHKIVDSYVDSDRMDYTCRDLYCAGVSKEFPRYERMFNTVKIYFQDLPAFKDEAKEDSAVYQNREKCYFAFNSKAIGQIELLLQRRWEDFANINYHHSVHKHELLLKLVVADLGKKYLKEKNKVDYTKEKEKNKKDKLENRLPNDISGIWLAMEKASGDGNVDKLFPQLDDEWLNTLIRTYFFDRYGNYYKDEYKNHNKIEWNRMDELVTGRKHYSPLFKRRGGFARFDEAFKKVVYNSGIQDELCPPEMQTKRMFFPTLLSYINKKYALFFASDEYYERVNREVQKWAKSAEAQSLHIIDCILDCNTISPGISGSEHENDVLLLSTEKGEKPKFLTEQSLIVESLDNQKTVFPPFHVFYLPEYDLRKSEYIPVDKKLLSEKVAEIMFKTMVEMKAEAEKCKEEEKKNAITKDKIGDTSKEISVNNAVSTPPNKRRKKSVEKQDNL